MVSLGPETTQLLADLANDSFKRQAELDESVWRSLPFFGATLALAAAIIGRVASDAPLPSQLAFPLLTNVALVLSTASFGWALRWFWSVVRAREYEYPASDIDVHGYAVAMAAYYAATGSPLADSDGQVVHELRSLMFDQYANAARTNFSHNSERMKARSQVLLFMMVGFMLAFSAEALIFVHRAAGRASIGAIHGDNARESAGAERNITQATCSPEVARDDGRGRVRQAELKADHPEKMTADPPPKAPPPQVQRPAPPPPQHVEKNDDGFPSKKTR